MSGCKNNRRVSLIKMWLICSNKTQVYCRLGHVKTRQKTYKQTVAVFKPQRTHTSNHWNLLLPVIKWYCEHASPFSCSCLVSRSLHFLWHPFCYLGISTVCFNFICPTIPLSLMHFILSTVSKNACCPRPTPQSDGRFSF